MRTCAAAAVGGNGWRRLPCGCSTAVLRIGSEEYAETNGSRGVATLLRNHVAVKGGEIRLDFPAKSGVQRTLTIEDGPLATAIRSLLRTGAPSDRLVVYRKGGRWTEVHADDINARFKECGGGGVHRQGPPHLARHRDRGSDVRGPRARWLQTGPRLGRSRGHA
ncbi:hypothetical protein ACH47B_30835 [Rhodococcus sp. NPDC019627]|uniref:hypothetical protein n=1 Tax=unclassified Rhodococcus (in: high G+C Gram-positive bacteria) TaxID=192944 RepID=UPI0033C96195